MWCRVVYWIATDVSEEQLATCLLAGSRWNYFFDPEDGGDVPPKPRLQLNRLHGVTSQQMILLVIHTFENPAISLMIWSISYFVLVYSKEKKGGGGSGYLTLNISTNCCNTVIKSHLNPQTTAKCIQYRGTECQWVGFTSRLSLRQKEGSWRTIVGHVGRMGASQQY
jgi:hypothetical protein